MKNGLYFVVFALGAVSGSLGAWQFAKKKYERICQEEIDSVKEAFRKKKCAAAKKADEKDDVSDLVEKRDTKDDAPDALAYSSKFEKVYRPDISEYKEKVSNLGYDKCFGNAEKEEEEKEGTDVMEMPYVISPEEFGEFDGYEKISLTYYADKVVADDLDEIVEDVAETIGFDSLGHFGDYEDDSVFVRNDRLKCDYEVLLDQRRYEDVVRGVL